MFDMFIIVNFTLEGTFVTLLSHYTYVCFTLSQSDLFLFPVTLQPSFLYVYRYPFFFIYNGITLFLLNTHYLTFSDFSVKTLPTTYYLDLYIYSNPSNFRYNFVKLKRFLLPLSNSLKYVSPLN